MVDAFYISMDDWLHDQNLIDSMLEAAVDAALIIDHNMKIRFMSAGFENMTGQSFLQLEDHPVDELKLQDPEAVKKVLNTGIRSTATLMVIGGQRLLATITPIIGDGIVLGAAVLVHFRSMTVLKRALALFDRQNSIENGGIVEESPVHSDYAFSDFVGEHPNVLHTIEQCQRIAYSRHPVLLVGETGVGKEIIANAIFSEYSGNKSMPFVKINCSAIPRDLLESELFGHEKGAFTGANAAKKGKFEVAAGGVLLLDEIGEMDISLQSKLLRVLEEKEFERIGGNRLIPLTARIIASTNQNIKQLAATGKFRLDLYYRLNTFEINLPPLRAHKSDLPLLIDHFQRIDNLKLQFTDEASSMLINYDWPGNVRELRNVLNRLYFLYPDSIIGVRQVYDATGEMFSYIQLPTYRSFDDPLPKPTRGVAKSDYTADVTSSEASVTAERENSRWADMTLKQVERRHISEVLAVNDFNLSKASQSLGISRSTLYDKIKKHNIAIDRQINFEDPE